MGERRALVVAVPRYELNEKFADLSTIVHQDVEHLQAALTSSHYNVEVLGLDRDKAANKSAIRSAISRTACTAPEGATLLVHFTGHGLADLEGTDYLVPADAQLKWDTSPPRIDPDSLLGLDLDSLLAGCRAETVLFTVDACRVDAADGGQPGWGRAPVFPAYPTRVAVLFGCGPDEECGSDEEQGSHFSRALAEALQADSPPRTLAEVLDSTKRRTVELARAAGQGRQQPVEQYHPSAHADDIGAVELCSGRTLHEDWATAVRDAQLWAAVECGDARRRELQAALDALVSRCAEGCTRASAGRTDPWADPDYPVRVLTRGLRLLVAPSETKGGPLLDPGEFAVLAAAPFVREAVYAYGLKALQDVEPLSLEPAVGPIALEQRRADLEQTWAAHPMVWRKGRELAERGRVEEARAVASWLLHRHLRGQESLWETYAPVLLKQLSLTLLGDPAGDQPASRSAAPELVDELIRITRSVGLMPSQPYEDEEASAGERWRLKELRTVCADRTDEVSERWRPEQLSRLLGLAGLLAGDLCELPGVLVDNIGVADGLTPAQAVAAARELRWTRDEHTNTFDLQLACPHPAVHAALTTLTTWSDDAVQLVRRNRRPDHDDVFRFVPSRVTDTGLRPGYDPDSKSDAYALPLMRFSLAEDEMRELLMGPRLYGDRDLALRELYQNALDACRYRLARARYAAKAQGASIGWEGEIVFRQGTDAAGRSYVECEDNGVGMSRRTLHGTFARAGRRFEQSREFRQEQARWRRADAELRLYPNSRFGIGVFSYFMMADEISIFTRATDEYGQAASGAPRGLRVDIASTGSLFRIKEGDRSVPAGGTRVRLYVQDGSVDVAEVLAALVWRSEFALRVERDGVVVRRWEPGRLYYNGEGNQAVAAAEDLWWVPDEGQLLADGLVVGRIKRSTSQGPALDVRRPGPPVPHGCVVNLHGRHAPELSASRTEFLTWPKEHVAALIRSASADFVKPPWFNLQWLWRLVESEEPAATLIARQLLARDETVRTGPHWIAWSDVPMRQVGLFCLDSYVADGKVRIWEHMEERDSRWFTRAVIGWRTAVLRGCNIGLKGLPTASWPMPETLGGYPEPGGWEGRIPQSTSGLSWVFKAAVPGPNEPSTLGQWLQRLARWSIVGLRVPDGIDRERAHATLLDESDREILRALLRVASADGMPEAVGVLRVLGIFSVDRGLPIPEALERARRFRELGIPLEVPAFLPAPPPDRPVTREELRCLRRHPDLWAPGDPMRASVEFDGSTYDRVVRDYAWLGLRHEAPVGGETRSVSLDDVAEADLRAFDLDRWDEVSRLTPTRLARASAKLALSCDEVLARHAKLLAELGVTIPEPDLFADRVFSGQELALLGGQKPREVDLDAVPMSLVDTAHAVRSIGTDPVLIREAARGLVELGLLDGRVNDSLDAWLDWREGEWDLLPDGASSDVDLPRVIRLVSDVVELPNVKQMFTAPYAVTAAFKTGRDAADVYAALRRIGPTVGVDVPPVPEGIHTLTGVRPTRADAEACIRVAELMALAERSADAYPQTLLGAAVLTRHALDSGWTLGDSVTALNRYAPLGSLRWGELSGEEWEAHRPTPHDVALFGPDLIGGGPVTPLDLLRVAARFGWSLDRAWRRITMYRPLGVELAVPEPELDVVPGWEDLILLSERLSGRAPVVTGGITPERVALLAREVERPTCWVRDRYALYADLFGLTLPDSCPDEPLPMPEAVPFRPDAAPGGDAHG
ncbi:HD domain-containing protein [Streptacidiphilus jiangxiensis]|uniref:Caspase domain-containing protein n=1 Tax=Streptacidiphilus jiangxiensis TaxID=235985 RepID=A0A1H7GB94_STRJI|nr:caspase family protein [Streptacidiphilus jiangxiensis]SEK35388.1 Caspase domain-containing protein [Streptacidiphilus jiangxiensis]